eukprot:Nitzschia sp. Nitz4//scaffold69_size99277//83618//88411//NITZ4_004647-RA/size99277-augustus-gene-0.30-mRNA-1//-1//CDS//3329556757//4682//frame0
MGQPWDESDSSTEGDMIRLESKLEELRAMDNPTGGSSTKAGPLGTAVPQARPPFLKHLSSPSEEASTDSLISSDFNDPMSQGAVPPRSISIEQPQENFPPRHDYHDAPFLSKLTPKPMEETCEPHNSEPQSNGKEMMGVESPASSSGGDDDESSTSSSSSESSDTSSSDSEDQFPQESLSVQSLPNDPQAALVTMTSRLCHRSENPRGLDNDQSDRSIQKQSNAILPFNLEPCQSQVDRPPRDSETNTPVQEPKDLEKEHLPQVSSMRGDNKKHVVQELLVSDEPVPEVHYEHYIPPTHVPRQPPHVHSFSAQNRPKNSRYQVRVDALFSDPVKKLWDGKFERFNALQSEVSNTLCHSDDHVIVSAPTGAGKTALFEMALARFITSDLQQQSVRHLPKSRKMVYVAPSKALCEERRNDWTRRLANLQLGIEVAMITGDVDPGTCYHDLASAHLILTTPEKWDSITRKWNENFYLLASVKLFMIDEVHMIGDDSRGACLESVVARMKTIQRAAKAVQPTRNELLASSYPATTVQSLASSLRFIAVSATLPNIDDVAEFLGAYEAYAFDESFRPVPLTKHVVSLGYVGKNEYRFWNSFDRHVPELINRFASGKQTLIFCHTKRETEQLTCLLIEQGIFSQGHRATSAAPPGTVQHCLDHGIAYHNAGVAMADRHRIEHSFANGSLRCLCATSTLAVGVNLPAHLVIVKGTKTWRGGGSGYQDIDKGSLLQMIGRAGRPGLDTSGVAVIMTDNQSKATVEHLMKGLGTAESRLLSRLADVINTEISQRVISCPDSALSWLKSTYFFSRIKKQPAKYAMGPVWESVDTYLHHLVQKVVMDLAETGLIKLEEGDAIAPLPASHIMSQSMVPMECMKLIASLPHDSSQCQLLKCIAQMNSLQFNVRRHEKKHLNECHKRESIRFKLEGPASKVRVQSPWEKSFVLLQAYIGRESFDDFTLGKEMSQLAENAQRLLLAMQEYSIKASRNGSVAFQCLRLRRSLHFALWGEMDGVLSQIEGVGSTASNQLKFIGICTFQQVTTATEQDIEKATCNPKPFGKKVKTLVDILLRSKLSLSAHIEFTRGAGLAAGVICTLTKPDFCDATTSSTQEAAVTYTLLAYADDPGTCTLFKEGIASPGTFRFSPPSGFKKIHVQLVASLIGLDESVVLEAEKKTQTTRHRFQSKPRLRDGNQRAVVQSTLSAKNRTQFHRATTPSSSQPISEGSKAEASRTSPILHTGKNGNSDQVRPLPPQKQQRSSTKPAPVSEWSPHGPALLAQTPREHISSIAMVTPATSGTSTNQAVVQCASDPQLRKRAASHEWCNSWRKQQRQQQRAFTSKKDNPFSLFQHDPNDAESFLEDLSSKSRSPSQSVIPVNLPKHRKPPGPMWANTRRRRLPRFENQYRVSDQELLRRKADEANSIAFHGAPGFTATPALDPGLGYDIQSNGLFPPPSQHYQQDQGSWSFPSGIQAQPTNRWGITQQTPHPSESYWGNNPNSWEGTGNPLSVPRYSQHPGFVPPPPTADWSHPSIGPFYYQQESVPQMPEHRQENYSGWQGNFY